MQYYHLGVTGALPKPMPRVCLQLVVTDVPVYEILEIGSCRISLLAIEQTHGVHVGKGLGIVAVLLLAETVFKDKESVSDTDSKVVSAII